LKGDFQMQRILRYSSIALATLGLGLGVAAADSAQIDTTGPHSNNQATFNTNRTATLNNNNRIDVDNNNHQRASSGRVNVTGNTRAGDASSGNASNRNSTNTNVAVSNDSHSAGLGSGFFTGGNNDASINLTGPNSNNQVRFTDNRTLRVTNTNKVDVDNHNYQDAYSGSATVSGNTIGGSATSGSASNTNNTSTSVNVRN
jgi:hypothetical protein